ncbi:MAG: stage V sporulation protein AD [Eubacteriales bacterium]
MKNRTIFPSVRPQILSAASVGGIRESTSAFGKLLDIRSEDDRFGKKTWEDAEAEIQRLTLDTALKKASLSANDLDAMFAGDLLNQCTASTFGLVGFRAPFFGIFGACSTIAEGFSLATFALSCGLSLCSVTASSHNLSAERQFRSPVEYGGQRTPTAQWTVTGGASFLLSAARRGQCSPLAEIVSLTPGCILDGGISDQSNMGAAMAPAAADTFLAYFASTGSSPDDFDYLFTGDLGQEGSALFKILMKNNGFPELKNHRDCGLLLYDANDPDTKNGASGCGCSASVLAARILPDLASGKIRNILFCPTGALMNATTVQQGKTIPGIAHLLHIKAIGR